MTIDWTKPLELMDGTPVVPYYSDRSTGWPDEAGQYHVAETNERLVGFFNEDGSLYPYSGVSEDTRFRVRNRDETPAKTLRDEFAMAALDGVCYENGTAERMATLNATQAYAIADAMMAARK